MQLGQQPCQCQGTVGLIGTPDTTAAMLSQLCGVSFPGVSSLPPEVDDARAMFEAPAGTKAHFDPASRVLYIQLATPASILDLHSGLSASEGRDKPDIREALWEGRSRFLKSALQLLVSCQVVVWEQEEGRMNTGLLEQLRILQAARQACPTPSTLGGPANLMLAFPCSKSQPPDPLDLSSQVQAAWKLLEQPGTLPLFRVVEQFRHVVVPPIKKYRQAVMDQALLAVSGLKLLDDSVGNYRELCVAVAQILAGTRQPGTQAPLLKEWCKHFGKVAQQLHKGKARDAESLKPPAGKPSFAPASHVIDSLQDPTGRLSTEICQKALDRGIAAYQRDLPGSYTKEVHQGALARALRHFSATARGPMKASFELKLKQACEHHWRSGKQVCGEASLTGHPCILAPHPQVQSKGGACRGHDSGISLHVADAAGMARLRRADPFDIAAANSLPEGHEVQGVELRSLGVCMSKQGARLERGAGGAACEPWACLAVHKTRQGNEGDVSAIAEGLDPGQGRLHALPLPLPVDAAPEVAAESESASPLKKVVDNLDLEFPPLLAANPPGTGVQTEKEIAKLDKERKAQERAELQRSLVKSGWPGETWKELLKVATTPSKAQGRKAGRGRGKEREKEIGKSPQLAPAIQQDFLYAGFEYESHQGRRCLLTPQMLPTSHASKPPPHALTSLLSQDLPLVIQLPKLQQILQKPPRKQDAARASPQKTPPGPPMTEMGQLMRIWVAAPSGCLKFSLRPVVRIEDMSFQLEDDVLIPAGRTCVLTLPRFYAAQGDPKAREGKDGDEGALEVEASADGESGDGKGGQTAPKTWILLDVMKGFSAGQRAFLAAGALAPV